jgi:hypothetical protein
VAAISIECAAPLWPHGSPYWTPNANPMMSRSGSIANADHAAIAGHRGARRVSYARAAAIPTAMCPTLAISYVEHYKFDWRQFDAVLPAPDWTTGQSPQDGAKYCGFQSCPYDRSTQLL